MRLFNQCANFKPGCEFSLGDEDIRIEFSGDALSNLHECSSQLAPDTVLLIEVTPKKTLPLARLRLKRKDLRAFDPSPKEQGYKGYLDDKGGLVLSTYEGDVLQLDYIAAAQDRHLFRNYYEQPEAFVQRMLFLHSPVLFITCPPDKPEAGEQITFSADIALTPKITFDWTVSAGKIIKGQGTRTIIVDTTGLEGQSIKATVTLGAHVTTCEVHVAPPKKGNSLHDSSKG